MTYRSFIALETPEASHTCLTGHLRWLRPLAGVNWVKDENLHLTLLFLGDVDSARIPELTGILGEAAGRTAPFELALRGLELFPHKAPRLVWASLEARDDALSRWHKRLLGEVRAGGFEPDAKPLRLHITLGRMKAALPAEVERSILQSEVDKGFQAYDRLTLFRSVLKPDGPVYHALEQFELN